MFEFIKTKIEQRKPKDEMLEQHQELKKFFHAVQQEFYQLVFRYKPFYGFHVDISDEAYYYVSPDKVTINIVFWFDAVRLVVCCDVSYNIRDNTRDLAMKIFEHTKDYFHKHVENQVQHKMDPIL